MPNNRSRAVNDAFGKKVDKFIPKSLKDLSDEELKRLRKKNPSNWQVIGEVLRRRRLRIEKGGRF